MHKSRNRKVSRPQPGTPPEPPFLLRPGTSPAFPADLIVPPHRGAVITSMLWEVPIPVAREPLRRPRPAPEPAPPVDPPEALAPLPAARAPALRPQGFVDIIAFVLRDSGRRLARWSRARHRQEVTDKLARAEARMRAMEAQLAALQALRDRVR
jgi:hypothetical protein